MPAEQSLSWESQVILSDRSLREAIAAGRLVIDPLDDDAIQPSSIDVRLDNRFRVFYTARHPYIDVKQPMDDLTELVEVKPDDAFILHPGEFVLGSSLERVGIPPDLAARLEGKSSLGRLGLMTHSTAGAVTTSSVVDPMDDAGSFDNPRSSWGAGSGAQGERKFSQYRDGVGPRCP